jgi:amino acid adenylation domain-containing protein
MNHRGFDGVDVLRLINRRYASQQAVAMPIVFTSALGLSGSRSSDASGEFLSTLIRLGEDSSYGISQSSQVWLDHVVRESAGALGLSWDSLEALFPEGLLDDMFAAYCGLLDSFADERLGLDDRVELPLPRAQAARRAEVNATAAPMPEGLLHEPFLARAAEDGDLVAVRHATTTLAYRELRALGLGIARHLDVLDGGRSTLIAVVMTKGWEQVAAVLGILCHGAGYLPIDANLPEERIHLLLQQAGVSTVLVQADLASALRFPEGTRILPVSRDLADDSAPLPTARRTPEDIAYVIFTSGSTGIPKGVVIEHRGALNTVIDINRRFRVGRDDRVLCVSALSFDLSVYDIFGVLGAGGTLVIPEADRDKDPAHWLDLVENDGVTVWNTVPPLLQLLVEQAEHRGGRGLASLRLALSSGDWLPPELPDRLTALRPGMELISLGGATEASIWSIYYPVLTSMAGRRSVPYGRPLDNQTFHVLDDALQDRPDWATGQLYIGGIGLAREYWGDADKTAASFIHDPKSGERLYRTGDLGRYLPDGDIEFLGRNDSQVKIRGNRVELGEIEAALRRAEGIRDAIVVAQGDKFGKRRLVAYVVPDFGGETPDGVPDGGIEVLADPVARAAFKFERRGLRHFDEATPATPLPGALRADGEIALAFPVYPSTDAADNVPLPLSRLGVWLAYLADIEADGHSLPKRLYPSAGSTYALQCYLRVGEGRVEGLPAGGYYFDPERHRLVRVATPAAAPVIERDGIDLFLIAEHRAVAPLYGRYAEKFAALEAGHVRLLLAGAAAAHGIALTDGVCDAGLAAEFALSAGHQPLIALRATGCASTADVLTIATTARQSYRSFDGGPLSIDALRSFLVELPPTPFEILVSIHGERADAHEGQGDDPADAQLFRLDIATAALVPAGLVDRAQLRRNQGIENRALHDAAQFTLYLLGDDAPSAWFAAGQWAQQAMHLGPERGFGFSPVGNLAMAGLRDPEHDTQADLVYALVGGRIAPEQVARWSADASATTSDAHQELRRFLAQSLPDYMIPSVFATIPRIPLSANGKLDRSALPPVGEDALAQPRAYVAPEGPLEQSVAALWKQIVGRETIGVHDNFFEIGGDSLSAIRLLSALRREFEAQTAGTTLRFVFEHPTIRAMAERLQAGDQVDRLEQTAAALALAEDELDEGEL